ncbi:ras GTPase-activating-like protein IQGAP2 [Gracilinanus agilis]|uniref:ras GTPase-activating-like protein IQGAP2 n=1 Tax=Gracilinanus agilis TaxID=191870 RepID=UPI001CFC6588|nr:ras GTPase-activating-like protein IQGAP2 [Gracilinanus agilis]
MSAVILLNHALDTYELISISYLYASRLMSIKREVESQGQDHLSRDEIQNLIDGVNVEIQEEKAMHAAVIAINEAIKEGIAEQTLVTLKNPKAILTSVDDSLSTNYQEELWEAKQRKEVIAKEKLPKSGTSKALTPGYFALTEISGATGDSHRLAAIDEINAVIREGHPSDTMTALMKPEAQLPPILPFAAVMYQNELFNLQKQNSLNYLAPEQLSMTVEMVSGVVLLNQALETEDLVLIQNHLQNPSIGITKVDEDHLERYASRLVSIKRQVSSQGQDNLSRDEIQNFLDIVNVEIQEEKALHAAVIAINEAVKKGSAEQTLVTLKNPKAALISVNDSLSSNYQEELREAKQRKEEIAKVKIILLSEEERDAYQDLLTQVEIQGTIYKINRLAAIDEINAVIREGHPSDTMTALMKPEAQLPPVLPFAAVMYQNELFSLQKENSLSYLDPEELSTRIEMVSGVVLLNQALESEDLVSIQNHLQNPSIGFNNLEEDHLERYASRLVSIKREASSQEQDHLSRDEMQNLLDIVNVEIQEEKALYAAVLAINEAIKEGIAEQTLVTLKNPKAGLTSVDDNLSSNYQEGLWGAKQKKEEIAKVESILLSEEERDAYQDLLTQVEIQGIVNRINRLAAIDEINAVIREGHPSDTMTALMKLEAQLPPVLPFAAVMYQNELFSLQKENSLNYLAPEQVSMTIEMVSGIVLLNQALETEDVVSIQNHLQNPSIGFTKVDDKHLERYVSVLVSIKREASSEGQHNFSRDEIQNVLDLINVEIQEEKGMYAAVLAINEAIKEGVAEQTLVTLKNPKAGLTSLDDNLSSNYQEGLWGAKQKKEEIAKVEVLHEIMSKYKMEFTVCPVVRNITELSAEKE